MVAVEFNKYSEILGLLKWAGVMLDDVDHGPPSTRRTEMERRIARIREITATTPDMPLAKESYDPYEQGRSIFDKGESVSECLISAYRIRGGDVPNDFKRLAGWLDGLASLVRKGEADLSEKEEWTDPVYKGGREMYAEGKPARACIVTGDFSDLKVLTGWLDALKDDLIPSVDNRDE